MNKGVYKNRQGPPLRFPWDLLQPPRHCENLYSCGEIALLAEKETVNLFPLLAERYHSVHISGAARVDGRTLRDALLQSAQRNGAALLTGDATLQYNSNQVTGVAVGDESYSSDEVIVCAGAWANQLLEPLGIISK